MTWDGKERRMPNDDHDVLIEIKTDVKHIVSSLERHIKDDDIIQKQIKNDLLFHQKIVYGGVGIVGFIQFLSLVAKFGQ